jgi:hypothetical protein
MSPITPILTLPSTVAAVAVAAILAAIIEASSVLRIIFSPYWIFLLSDYLWLFN